MKTPEFARVASLWVAATLAATSAGADVVSHAVDADLTTLPGAAYSFQFEGAAFTFSASGDLFNPLAVASSGAGQIEAFGGFAGIPVSPSSNFVDRGTVIYGSDQQYAAFPTATTVPYSNGDNFIGLEAVDAGGAY